MKPAGAARFDDLSLLEEAARRAGAITLEFFRSSPKKWTKGNDSPVTEADIAADDYLKKALLEARPDYGWLSEETEDDTSRLERRRTFIVDPIDGTRGFIAGGDDWTVSIAITEDGIPVVAALFRPVTGEMYCAVEAGGVTRNGEAITASRQQAVAGALVAGPAKMLRQPALKRHGFEVAGYVRSLALRVAHVAEGRFDAAAARPRAHDWDLAAADLLVREAGGTLTDFEGGAIRYNRPSTRQPAFLAAAPAVHAELRQVLAAGARDAYKAAH